MKIMKKDRLAAFLQAVSGEMPLFLPVEKGATTAFARYTGEETPALSSVRTGVSPKDLFFPQCETLYTIKTDSPGIAIAPAARAQEDFAVFGIRGCDVHALEVLDEVFLRENTDTFYQARRQHGILLSLSCRRPDTACFCTVFGNDPAEPPGDVAVTEGENAWYWEEKTEKGRAFLKRFASFFREGDAVPCEEEKEKIRQIAARLPFGNLSLQGWGAGQTARRFEDPRWEKLAQGCLGCGTCTFVCPTCQCYDIRDYDTGRGYIHYRCWDSCMYSDFTMMSAGNNRTTQMQRYRQRFMHKLVYSVENNSGLYGCVGCGRCVTRCPSGLSIVKVLREMREEEAHV